MDYRIFNVHPWSFLYMHLYGSWAHRQRVCIFLDSEKLSQIFLVLLTGFKLRSPIYIIESLSSEPPCHWVTECHPICVCVWLWVTMCVYVTVSDHVCVCVCVRAHVCVFEWEQQEEQELEKLLVLKSRERERERERERDRERECRSSCNCWNKKMTALSLILASPVAEWMPSSTFWANPIGATSGEKYLL